MNNNKLVNVMGLTREHFKLANHVVSEFITSFLNYRL